MKFWRVIALASLSAFALVANVPGTSEKKMIGNYAYKSSAFNATFILAENRVISRFGATPTSHPVAGKWWYKGNKDMIIARFPDAVLTGIIVNLNTITGTYKRLNRAPELFVMARTNATLFHLKMDLCKPKRAHGVVVYNWNKSVTLSGFKIAVYSRLAGLGRLEKERGKFTKLGFFTSGLQKPYDFAEAYLLRASFTPPNPLPAPLPVDGTNVFAYDFATNGFRFLDWSTTNDPSFF
ncbi:MAG: hypothetical protein N2595_08420 [bacterium]|nr:hypothetical protein [bacterium]